MEEREESEAWLTAKGAGLENRLLTEHAKQTLLDVLLLVMSQRADWVLKMMHLPLQLDLRPPCTSEKQSEHFTDSETSTLSAVCNFCFPSPCRFGIRTRSPALY